MGKDTKKLVGETIKKAIIKGVKDFDDRHILRLEMESGRVFEITSSFSGFWTGKSISEYPSFINVENKRID